ncbi:MAG: CBS domain-containing protein [Cryomorphaceae bacterium]|nr:CBS domain-containing protein [Cryomorphaceae bacterium]
MKSTDSISEIMTTNVITIKVDDDLREVKKTFAKKNIRHLPVMDGDKLVGMISKNDVMRLSFGNVFDNEDSADDAIFDMLSVDNVMTHNLHSVTTETTIKEVAEIFVESHFHSLPVVDNDGRVVGIVTSTDVIKVLLRIL